MKSIYVIGLILVSALVIVWGFEIWSTEQWKNKTLQREGSEDFYEQKRRLADAEEDRLGKKIDHWVRAIKSIGHRSRRSPPGVYFTLTYIPVRNPSGITGVEPGTQVVCVKDEGPMLLVKEGNLEFEARRQYLTNDIDVADLAARNDAEAQQAVASYIAKQRQAIDQRNEKRKMPPSGQR